MWSLNCAYYTKSFQRLELLLEAILLDGMDPNYELLFNGEPTGEMAIDLMNL